MRFCWSGSRISQRGARPQPKDEAPTNSWPTDHRDSVHGICVDSRDSRVVLLLPTNYANERESKSAQRCAALRSGRSSEFRIPNCTAFRPRNLRTDDKTDFKAGNAPPASDVGLCDCLIAGIWYRITVAGANLGVIAFGHGEVSHTHSGKASPRGDVGKRLAGDL